MVYLEDDEYLDENEDLDEAVASYDLIDKIRNSLYKASYDLRGHFHGTDKNELIEYLKSHMGLYTCRDLNSMEDIKSVVATCEKRKPSSVKIKLDGSYSKCYSCDEEVVFLFDGVTATAQHKCPYPNGLPEYSIDLAAPSGKLVVANDLRNLFKNEYEEEDTRPSSRGWGFNVNSDYGCMQVFKKYGELGMAHGFVGNSCPGVYRLNDITLTISMIEYDKETYENKSPPGERVAGVCTDLWWYSIVDYDDYVRRTGEEPNKWCNVVDVIPGTYRVTHRTHIIDRDANITDHYAILTWIKKDAKLKEIKEREIVAVEDAIKANIIFGVGQGNRGNALNDFFFTIGSSFKWYKGCIVGPMSPKKLLDGIANSRIKIPTDLERRMKDIKMDRIYPLNESYSKIFSVPDDVQPDWLLAAFEAIDVALALDPKMEYSIDYKNSDMIVLAKKAKQQLEKRFGTRDEIISKHHKIS